MKTPAILVAALTLASASAQKPAKLEVARFRIRELVCHGCSLEVFKSLAGTPGFVRVLDSNTKLNELKVLYDPKATTPTRLSQRITRKTGWKAPVLGSENRGGNRSVRRSHSL